MAELKDIPPPMRKRLKHLNLDIEKSLELMSQEKGKDVCECLMCEVFLSCDYNLEGNYYVCPNRDFFERLRRFAQ